MNKIILIIAIILLVGVGGYFIFRGGYKTPSQINQQSPTMKNEIAVQGFAFSPAALTIKKGTMVTWTNNDSVPHNIKFNTFNSEILNKGESFQFKFDNAGTYDYTCAIHPTMKGEIVVQD